MPCNDCGNSQHAHYSYNPQNNSCKGKCSCQGDASNIVYTGPTLTCTDIVSNTTVEIILQSLDGKICEISGVDWSGFNYQCLSSSYDITDAKSFAEAISDKLCSITTDVEDQVAAVQENVDELETLVNDINTPGPITGCSPLFSLTSDDTLSSSFTKVGSALCSLNTLISSAYTVPDWDACFTVATPPSTLQGAFGIILDQICTLKSEVDGMSSSTLPTFNNVGSCLSSPGATDSLYDTVVKIRTKLCTLPTFDINTLTWGTCVTNPAPGTGANLNAIFNLLISRVDAAYSQRIISFSSDFDVALTSPGDYCSGYTVSLNASSGLTDELVALSVGDTPGYLLDKISAGTNINFDTSTPGQVVINSTAQDIRVKANAADTSGDYLINKIYGSVDSSSSISITESYDGTLDKVKLTPSIDWENFNTEFITQLLANPTWMAQWCSMMCDCAPCSTTTSTTTVVGDFIVFVITNNFDNPITVSINTTEASTPLFVGSLSMTPAQVITTGAYFTTTGYPITGDITLVNTGTENLAYSVSVEDGSSTPVPGSTTSSGPFVGGATIPLSPFVYGSVVDKYVYITFS